MDGKHNMRIVKKGIRGCRRMDRCSRVAGVYVH